MRIKHAALLTLILGLCSTPAWAQERLTEHTLKPSGGKPSPAAAIADLAWLAGQSQSAEEDAARVPLENYLKGHATGDGEFMKKAFHPDAKVFSFRDGKLQQLTSSEFAARFTGKPAPDEAQRKRWIESIKITGNAGVGVIVLDYPTVKFTDYMSLLKVDGEWKIINKTFYAEPKTKP